MAEKTVNYTEEMTASLIEQYQNGTSVEDLANIFSKTTRSIVAKLSRSGVYKKKEYISKTGNAPIKKDAIADQIGMLLGFTEAEIESISKANKTALNKILDCVKESKLNSDNLVL
jgi:Zn-dependent M32 family carboxypeptidase